MKGRLTGTRAPAQSDGKLVSPSVDSLLEQLSRVSAGHGERNGNPDPIESLNDVSPPGRKPGLIEEISSAELESDAEEPATPEYEMSLAEDDCGKPQAVQLSVVLPLLSSVAECDLSVSEDDLVIDVPGLYRLELHLPEEVSQDSVRAKFSKKTRVLSVTMAIK